MKSIIFLVLSVAAFCINANSQIPAVFSSTGLSGGGALFSPSINPANHNEIAVACDMSEVYHSATGGASWDQFNFRQLQGGHFSKLVYTRNKDTLYCLSHFLSGAVSRIKPVKSIDGGLTWNELPGNPDTTSDMYNLSADFKNPNRVLLNSYNTLYFSTDGGNTFSKIHGALSSSAGIEVGGVFYDGTSIYVGTNDGIIYSTNSGATFSTLSTTGFGSGDAILSFAAARQNGTLRFICLTALSSNIWCGYTYGDNYTGALTGVYSMDNANGKWVKKMSGITVSTDYPVIAAMSENSINVAYLAGGSSSGKPIVLKTVNGGNTWKPVFETDSNANIETGWCGAGSSFSWTWAEAPFGFAVCANDSNTAIITDYGFVHITKNGGSTWEQKYIRAADENSTKTLITTKTYHGNGLENTSCWQVYWADSNTIWGGYSDIHGTLSKDKGQTWADISNTNYNSIYRIAKDDSGTVYIAVSSVHDMYQSTHLSDKSINGGTGAIYYTTNGGKTFSLLHNFGYPVVWIALDPSAPNRMYASVVNSINGGIFRCDDIRLGGTSTWKSVAAPSRTEGHPYNINVLKNGNLVVSFSGHIGSSGKFTASSGVFYSQDHGLSWSDRSDAKMQYWTMDVVVDPQDTTSATWYACVFDGWGVVAAKNCGGLYKTTNKGVTWNRISNSYRVNSCTLNPYNVDELFFTTESYGLWYSNNISSSTPTFTQVSAYPFREPMRVFYNPYKKDELWVTSFGNGIKVSGSTSLVDEKLPLTCHLKLYPNPAHTSITVTNLSKIDANIYIYNLFGQIVKSLNFKNEKATIDLSELPAGVYLVKYLNDVERFVKY